MGCLGSGGLLEHEVKMCPCHCSSVGGDFHLLLQVNLSNFGDNEAKKKKITMDKKEVPCEKPSLMENVFFDAEISCVCEVVAQL